MTVRGSVSWLVMSDTDFDLTSEGTLNFEKQTAFTGPAATCSATVGHCPAQKEPEGPGARAQATVQLGPRVKEK